MTADLLSLASRCEAADGPDRPLNIAIALALGWKQDGAFWQSSEMAEKREWSFGDPPDFTGSADAAATLMPKGSGWRWLVDKRPYADSGRPDGYCTVAWCALVVPYGTINAWCATEPLSRTAAALKALAAIKAADDQERMDASCGR